MSSLTHKKYSPRHPQMTPQLIPQTVLAAACLQSERPLIVHALWMKPFILAAAAIGLCHASVLHVLSQNGSVQNLGRYF